MDLKKVFVVGTAIFVIVCLSLFYVLTNSIRITNGRTQREINFENMEKKLASLEDAFQTHKKSMKELEALALAPNDNDIAANAVGGVENPLDPNPNGGSDDTGNELDLESPKEQSLTSSSCSASFGLEKQTSADVNMLEVYDLISFTNPNGGVWKQGWDIRKDESRFAPDNKLKVFVIPHSHNDPGWLKTFQKYFDDQTKHILNNMLLELSANPEMKFIWAEISYFDLWWKDLSPEQKKELLRIVENKQLEFVTGGWVMPDESSSHFYSILAQLMEGQQWLLRHLGYIPKNGWSIDPFGMSPTMAYILKRSGLSNMLIQRTHYSVKKHLSQLQQLEFKWRQMWDSSGSTDMMCHMMPFYSYDVPHTCGPDPKVCCQFDFKRMRGVSSMTCPWDVPPQPIVTKNLRERSLTLLDQYKKKAMLFKSNVLLIPLGDDFRWEDKPEWDGQRINYGKIFDYINSTPDLHTEIAFGTLGDYFSALGEEVKEGLFTPGVLAGDFFTYADRDDHYWSGYFTSRPYHKAMDRELMSHLRSAQLLFTTMSAELAKKVGDLSGNVFVRGLLGKLIKARRNLALFQHHDGVAGTSKDHVMVDYAERLYSGLVACNHVMEKSIHVLSHLKDPNFELPLQLEADGGGDPLAASVYYEPTFSSDHHHSLPEYDVLVVDKELSDRLITVYNPAPHSRMQLVTIYVSTYYIKVVDIDGEAIDFDILPVFEDRTTLSSNTFQLNFVTELVPMGIKNFIVKYDGNAHVEAPEILVINSPSSINDNDNFKIRSVGSDDPLSISNSILTINFKKDGFARSVLLHNEKEGKEHEFEVGMWKYGVKNHLETSGLYLFLPDGPAKALEVGKPFIKAVKGRFLSYVEVWLTQVKHRVTLYNHPGFEQNSISITNIVDIRAEKNFELALRLKTRIDSGSTFYTDLNGFQMIKRKKFAKLPIQGNYYPIPSAAFVEDSTLRMTLLSRQPLGGGSLSGGEIEVMMDRRLMQDDNRGAGQGDKDNLETVNSFKILFEVPSCQDPEAVGKPPMLSLAAHATLNDLLHPFRAFSSPNPLSAGTLSAIGDYSPQAQTQGGRQGQQDLPCDLELVDMSMIPNYGDSLDDSSYIPGNEVGITLRRVGFDGRFLSGDGAVQLQYCSREEGKLGRLTLKDLIGELFSPKMSQMTLTFVHEGRKLTTEEPILMKPMEIYAFKTHFVQGNNVV